MSIILEEAETGRLINVFQAFAMNIYKSLLICLQKPDGVIWVCTMVVCCEAMYVVFHSTFAAYIVYWRYAMLPYACEFLGFV